MQLIDPASDGESELPKNAVRETSMPMSHEAEARAVQRELGEGLIEKDLDRAIALMTADVTLLGSKGPAVVGDAAVVVGHQMTTLAPIRGGRPTTLSVRVVGVYRREGGSWKLARALSVFAATAAWRWAG